MDVRNLLAAKYKANYKQWYSFVKRSNITPEHAEDIVHDAAVRAIIYEYACTSEEEFDDWFHGILLNAMKDKMREEKMMGMSTEYNEELDLRPSSEPREELLEEVRSYMQSFGGKKADICYDYYTLGLTASQIAGKHSMGVGAVKMAIKRVAEQLREKYGT